MFEILKPDFEFKDERGKLIQLVHEGFEQINVLETNKGVFRGGHFHKKAKEAFFIISGVVQVSFKIDNLEEEKRFCAGDFFLIEPYVVHSMYFEENTIMVAMYDRCVENSNGEKDIYNG